MMKLLVAGSDSQVGRAFVLLLNQRAIPYECLSVTEALTADIESLVKKFREHAISFVVNVDHLDGFDAGDLGQRELEQRHIFLPQQLAKLAESLNIPLVQLSDYQVFSGADDRPYSEEDEPHSQTLYGLTRWQGELSVQRFIRRFVILRAGTIFCEEGNNILTHMLAQWTQGQGYELSTQVQFSPTPTDDVARVIYAILQQLDCDAQAWGIYHYCSADIATPYDFAEAFLATAVQFSARYATVKIVSTSGEPSQRKQKNRLGQMNRVNQILLCKKILNTFGISQRPWRSELAVMIEKMSHSHPFFN